MRVRVFNGIFFLASLSVASPSFAHFDLKAPAPSSNSTNGGKGPAPCGPDDPSDVVTNVTGGSMLQIVIDETVYHSGHYRVALSIDSRDDLPMEPVVKDADGNVLPPQGPGNSKSTEIMNPPVFPVLADGLFPHTAPPQGMFMGNVMIPNVNCDRCTLQVIQFMSDDHPAPYFYRHCADLKVTADPNKPMFDPDNPNGMGGTGGMGGTAGSGGMAGGGTGGSGGMTSAGTGGMATAGTSAGGMGGRAGAGGTAGAGMMNPASSGDDGGCSFSVSSAPRAAGLGIALLSAFGLLLRRRRD
jgi:MYXO-CTERM domain-containing protein